MVKIIKTNYLRSLEIVLGAHNKWGNISSRKSTKYQEKQWGYVAFEPQLTVFPCCQFHVTGALSWALWERRSPSAPSAQSQEKQAAFTSHSHPHPHPQPHTAGILFQTGFPERTRCLFPHPVPICIASTRGMTDEEYLGPELHSPQLTQRSEFPLHEWHV